MRGIYIADGHKLILVEGIPTIFSWENIEQFDGNSKRVRLIKAELNLSLQAPAGLYNPSDSQSPDQPSQ